MKPTPAQIEAAVKALDEYYIGSNVYEVANAALTAAAAEVQTCTYPATPGPWLTAAAEVGEPHGPAISEAARLVEYADILVKERAATIERCAQVADNFQIRQIGDAIRALKDKP